MKTTMVTRRAWFATYGLKLTIVFITILLPLPAISAPSAFNIAESKRSYNTNFYQPVPGQLLLCESAVNATGTGCVGAISDVLVFETPAVGFPFLATFYSDAPLDPNSPLTDTDAADVGISGINFSNPIAMLEDATGVTDYAPPAGKPGDPTRHTTPGVIWRICSDADGAPPRALLSSCDACGGCTVPEPMTLALLGIGLLIAVFRRDVLRPSMGTRVLG